MTALDISNYTITKCLADKHYINALSLQAVLYVAWKKYWALFKEELFPDLFIAYGFGPAVPEVWYKTCHFGSNYIWFWEAESNLEETFSDFLDPIIDYIRDLPLWDMMPLCQVDNGAWINAFTNGQALSGFSERLVFMNYNDIKQEAESDPVYNNL